jgi:hypothetical protein
MIKYLISLIALSFCLRAEAQIGLKLTLKGGVRAEGNGRFLSWEPDGIADNSTWYTYSGGIYISKIRTAFEWTYREDGRRAFLKLPQFLLAKSKVPRPPQKSPLSIKAGDTLYSYHEFSNHWFSVSFNAFPNKWKKHQLLVGAGFTKRIGGLNIVRSVNRYPWGVETTTTVASPKDALQRTILWKTEYVYMPFKYSLVSLRVNYAYYPKFPHLYYEFILSLGSYIDL